MHSQTALKHVNATSGWSTRQPPVGSRAHLATALQRDQACSIFWRFAYAATAGITWAKFHRPVWAVRRSMATEQSTSRRAHFWANWRCCRWPVNCICNPVALAFGVGALPRPPQWGNTRQDYGLTHQSQQSSTRGVSHDGIWNGRHMDAVGHRIGRVGDLGADQISIEVMKRTLA